MFSSSSKHLARAVAAFATAAGLGLSTLAFASTASAVSGIPSTPSVSTGPAFGGAMLAVYAEGSTSQPGKRHFAAAGAEVGMSPRGGRQQTVEASFDLQRLDASGFVTIETIRDSAVLDDLRVGFGGFVRGGLFQTTADPAATPEMYRLVYTVTWKDTRTGRLLDTRTVAPTLKSDSVCLGDQGPACVVGSNGVVRLS